MPRLFGALSQLRNKMCGGWTEGTTSTARQEGVKGEFAPCVSGIF